MLTSDAISHFKDNAGLAAALGIKAPSVYDWGTYPPPLRQLQIQALTKGELKAEPDCDKYRVPSKAAA